ncbi:hypothetical protein TrCOL_g11454 [Triparma columacea]|uniref:NADH:ubiquinone oxidoreductase intermediate-associated protein 30 domain-containing protein n=1 Tax=Triparma columacea TaxID=722753 RepID=A0A9W7G5E0_9STRA|nr:hypothetical protein TrCOL_g11454 [Triparma columacea]
MRVVVAHLIALVLLLSLTCSIDALRILSGIKQAIYFNSPFRRVKKMNVGDSLTNIYPKSINKFGPLDDVVMGGSSSSKFANGVWSGTIVTASGGFCGIRSLNFDLDASSYKGFEVTVRGGDGQRFKFITRDSGEWNGVAWTWEFDTSSSPSSVTKVRLPFSEARPTKFARTVPNAELDKSKLTTVQFTLSKFAFDGQLNPKFNGDGTFNLSIDSISLY